MKQILFIITLATLALTSCQTVVQKPTDGFEPASAGDSDNGLKKLLRVVKLEGRLDPEHKKLCASATVLGVGPEVCLGFARHKTEETPEPVPAPESPDLISSK